MKLPFRTYLLIGLLLILSQNLSAYDFIKDGIAYNFISVSDRTVEVTYINYSNSYSGIVSIPSTVNYSGKTYAVIAIGNSAFFGCKDLTNIELPNSINSFKSGAFCNCSELADITIPNSVTEIGENVFSGCTNFTKVFIPKSVKSIGPYCFNGLNKITSVITESDADFSKTELFIIKDNFRYKVLKKDSVAVSSNSYSGDIVILETVSAGNTFTVSSIDNKAFNDCWKVTSVTIPSSIQSVGDFAFSYCHKTKFLFINNRITSYGQHAFNYCQALTDINIPNDVKYIGDGAFGGCIKLKYNESENAYYIGNKENPYLVLIKSVSQNIDTCIINETCRFIHSYAFSNCTNLTNLTVPSNVNSIGNYAFTNVKNIIYSGNATGSPWGALNVNGYVDGDFVFADEAKTQLTAYIGSGGDVVIPDGVSTIGKYAFYNCKGLTSISIPSSVTSIEESAFYGCSGLSNVYIPDGLSYIGDYSFYSCSNLLNVSIPNSVISIGENAFSNNPGTLYIDVDTINTSFSTVINNSNFDKIILGDNVKYISDNTFCANEKLKTVIIGQNVTGIGADAFKDCTKLFRVLNKSQYFYVDSGSDKNGLVSYYAKIVYNGNVEIEDGFLIGGSGEWRTVYGYIGNEKTITLPSVKYISDYAFYDNYDESYYRRSIKTIFINNEISQIGNNLFRAKPIKTFWLTNILPQGYSNASGIINYASNDNFSSLSNVHIYPYLSSMFEVNGVKYVPTNLAERLCDAVDYSYRTSDSVLSLDKTVAYRNVPLTIKNINPYFAYEEVSLKSIELKGVSSIGTYAFGGYNRYDSKLKSILLSDIESIGEYAFQSCGAETLELNEIDSICDYAFASCNKLQSINIPASVSYVGGNSFYDCSGIKTITVASDNKKYDSRLGCNAIIETSTNKLIRGCQNTIIPNDITEIGDFAFRGCSNMNNIAIPESVITIGNYAFYSCSNLENITLPKNLQEIGSYAFQYCSKLSNIFIPNSVLNIGGYAFSNCDKLKNTVFESRENDRLTAPITRNYNNWKKTGNGYYKTYTALYSMKVEAGDVLQFDYLLGGKNTVFKVTLNEEVIVDAKGVKGSTYRKKFTKAQIVDLVMSYSVSNTSDYLEISNMSLKTIVPYLDLGIKLFNNSPIDSIYLGREITYTTNSTDKYSPFNQNKTLRSVVISDKETAILDNEFYGCTNLKNVSIGDRVKSIGKYAFSGCTSLETFIFGSNMKSIGQEAFSDCSAMKHLYSEAVVPPTCGSQALEDINKWECTLYVPNENIPQYQAADQWKDFFFVDANPFAGLQSYRITYMVDGVVYRVDSVEENSAIPAISLPSKDGYTFSGWEDIPAVMPSHDLVITGTFIKTATTMNVIDGEAYTTVALTSCDTLY